VLLGKAADIARNDTLSFLAASYGRLPSPDFWDRRTILARHRDKVVLNGLLNQLCAEEDGVCAAIDRAVKELNADVDALDEFLALQYYRLAYWKTADQQLGYRRFFDVNTLIGLRVEREHVFDETHALIVKWLKQGVLDGVRVDHPDGLRDPLQYFQRLRERAPEAWIIGEKILEPGEALRQNWPIAGTSGYDFLNAVMRLLVQPDGLARLGELYTEFTGDDCAFAAVAHDKKLAVEQEALGSDVNRLAALFVDICEGNRNQRDFTRAEIRRAIREVAACFAVYRSYVVPDRQEIADEDRQCIEAATECAKTKRQDIDGELFDFMRDVLQLKVTGKQESEFVYRFQQFTSPVMAKGVEDTAFYCYNRLTALNEVGGDPGSNGSSVGEFHAYNEAVQKRSPATMTALSTHDTKRSDDVRARLLVLSECPNSFADAAKRWSEQSKGYRGAAVDTGTEWFLYQTLVGTWPIPADRLKAYMQKAMREAKVHTSWVANNEEYEGALNSFIDGLLQDAVLVEDVAAYVATVVTAGRVNSLTQTLLKYTSPGVPDIYQGGELWDLSLVDPDNRRPVDYESRGRLLDEMKGMDAKQAMARMDDGLPKLWLVHHALRVRNAHPHWFGAEAEYLPVSARGLQAERVIAFRRGVAVMSVAQRWSHAKTPWDDTAVEFPPGQWRNELTGCTVSGGSVAVSTLLQPFPVALLTRI
jgi:(1->4)-alpha-D-glucan 1-alpha-D-glucosylmutase